MDRERQVEADQVGVLERTEHLQLQAKRALDHRVDILGRADAGLDEGDRLAPERVLQPVPNEARDVALDVHGCLAGRGEQGHRPLHDLAARLLRLRHLDERDQVRRIPEVGSDDALRTLGVLRDRPDRHHGRVRSEDRLRCSMRHPREQLLLQVELFRRRLDDERGPGNGLFDRLGELDPVDRADVSARALEIRAHPLVHGDEHVGTGIRDRDRMAGRREHLGDPVPHQAGADNGDPVHHPAV